MLSRWEDSENGKDLPIRVGEATGGWRESNKSVRRFIFQEPNIPS